MLTIQRRWLVCRETNWQSPSEWEDRVHIDDAEQEYVCRGAEYRIVENAP